MTRFERAVTWALVLLAITLAIAVFHDNLTGEKGRINPLLSRPLETPR